ncbi:MAG TPA: zinc-binding alcohol dehydrogenase [Polyangia bacterium]|nr:zinc-binding alcohol dehydrogenase [Polyangia bacterium]
MRRSALIFAGPRRVEIVEEELGPPPAGHVLVRAQVSAISAGTELLVYRGELPSDRPLDESLPALAGAPFSYPARYGYAVVGEVIAVGAGVPAARLGGRVFALAPHASAVVLPAPDAFAVPEGFDAERAALFASMETAVNLVLDGAPRLGERVAVLGQGIIGLLVTSLLSRFPLEALVAVEGDATRAARALSLGAGAAVPSLAEARGAFADGDGADVTFELTGDPRSLDAALALTGREGRVVVGSFYGTKRAPLDLGAHFHRGRLTIASSQVSALPPALTGRWDRARRRRAAWEALSRVDAAALVSHRFALGRAAEAYACLDAGPVEALQVLLTYD